MRAEDSHKIIEDVTQRIMQLYGRDNRIIERSILDTLYFERQRLEKESDRKVAATERKFYDQIQRRALRGSTTIQRKALREIVDRYANEVLGHFNPTIYQLASKAVPPALNLLVNRTSPQAILDAVTNKSASIADRLHIGGNTDAIKRLIKLGTIVMVPTHLSNLDSILIGFAIDQLGLPPFTYGAGYNLFSNRFMGFFMRNLGAYKVDRKKKDPLYKDILKTYAGCSMEMGYHNLFFPGGTRCRSGFIESNLKKGLLGTAIDAYTNNLLAHKPKPDIFVVPCTLNYQLVLEAETLIEDFLKETGQNRFIIEDDEFSRPSRIIDFVSKLFTLNSHISFIIGDPLDVFGNRVDLNGQSMDSNGRTIVRERYLYNSLQGKVMVDPQRDHEYVRELAVQIAQSYARDSVLNSTNLVCFTMFNLLKRANPDYDLFRLLRTGGMSESFPLREFYLELEFQLVKLRNLASESKLRLDEVLSQKDPVAIMNDALAHLKSYHLVCPIYRRGQFVFHDNRPLIYYYQNRVASYARILK